MKNLGSALLAIWLGMTTALFAEIDAMVDHSKVVQGDDVQFTIIVRGNQVEKPSINVLCGEPVTSTSQSASMRGVNGRYTKEYRFSYTFTPTKSCNIHPIDLIVDGTEETTNAIPIKVSTVSITKDAPYLLSMRVDKPTVRLGEPFKLIVTFKQRHGSDMVDSKFQPPNMRNFWIKEQVQSRSFEEGDYRVIHVVYVAAAQKEGTLYIDPAKIKVATRGSGRDAWGQWLPRLNWRTYPSNPVSVEVEPLPDNISLVGDLRIEAKVDRTEVDANDAVNVTYTISGSGNFEDIKSLKPEISGVAVFGEEPTVKGYIEQGEYKGFWKQKIAFVSERSFQIPSMEIRYFDTTTQEVKRIASEPIDITIRNEAPVKAEALTIERGEVEEETPPLKTPTLDHWEVPFGLGLLLGISLGITLMLLPWHRFLRKKEGIDLKDDKAVLHLLLPYRHDAEVAEMVEMLEQNLYGGVYRTVDRKALKALLKRLHH